MTWPPFLLNALLAGTAIAVAAGLVGYVVVLRAQVFTGDALSHVAFTGALAALALGASRVATRAAHGWQSGLSDRITVQVMPPEQGDVRAGLAAETRAALEGLNAPPGIAQARLLSDAEINALVEPWIGKDGAVSGIPLPRRR